MRHDDQDEERRRCEKVLQPYDSISVAEVGERCSRCFNEELAHRLGIDFDNAPSAPLVVTDVDRERHRFEILGDFEADARDLFELLRERIRQGLSAATWRSS